MATQAQTIPSVRTQRPPASSGLLGQIMALLTQPTAFFRRMPHSRQWILVAVIILAIFAYSASNQAQSDATETDVQQAQDFDLSLLRQDAGQQVEDVDTASIALPLPTSTTTDEVSNSTWMSALLAAGGVVLMWAGQTVLLSLVPMLRGRAPRIGRLMQVAVWSTLPLALMLVLRQVYFSTGGAGGEVGLSLLLEEWEGYSALPEGAQHLIAAFVSNISLFSLWSLALMYFGARYALNGRRWAVVLALLIWITAAPVISAYISEPVTTVSPRSSITVEQTTDDTSTDGDATTPQTDFGGGFPGGGNFPADGGGGRPAGGGRGAPGG